MARAFDQRHVHRTRRPLEAVGRAEQRLETLRALLSGRVLLQGQQVAVQRADVFLEFFEEGLHQPLDELVLVHAGISPICRRAE